MDKLNCNRLVSRLTFSLCLTATLSACGGGGGGATESQAPVADATVQSISSGPIVENTGTPEFTPILGSTLDVAYADPGQSYDEFIDAQWQHMQTCLEVSAVEPLVTVLTGKITPLSSNDDVVRHIDGQIQASANVSDTGASIQVRSADFDGSLGKPGAYLRSIMGRYLWFSNALAERLYEFDCAKGADS